MSKPPPPKSIAKGPAAPVAKAATPKAAPPKAAPPKAAPSTAALPKAAPPKTAPPKATPPKAAPPKAAPPKAAPPKAAPTEAAPAKAAPPKAAPTEAAPIKAAPPTAAPTEASPEDASANASVPPQQQTLEQKYEKDLKFVLAKLLNNIQGEELAFTWFLKRYDVHRRERDLIDDPYQAMGMDYREEATEEDIKRAAECLTALDAEPEKREIVAKLCEWLRYQALSPRELHLYPEELKIVCEPAGKTRVVELAEIVNTFFEPEDEKVKG